MRSGGIYRHDPQPAQGRRFVPIPAQGDQPPRRNPAMLGMVAVLSCWPTGLEHQPQQRRVQIAPIAAQVAVEHVPATRRQPYFESAWNAVQSRAGIAPLTLTYGDEPPRRSESARYAVLEGWRPPPPAPRQLPGNIAPLTLAYGDAPPRWTPARLYATLESWRPRAPQPQQRPLRIAPLTLAYGDQPPPHSIALRSAIIGSAWQLAAAPVQRRATYIAPPPAAADNPPPRSRYAASVPIWWIPPQPQPHQRPITFSPAINQHVRTGTAANDPSGGFPDWVNEGNVAVSDDTYCTATFPSSGSTAFSEWLFLSNLEFGLPSTATVRGIQVDIECKVDDLGGTPQFDELILRKQGTAAGDNKGSGIAWRLIESTLRFGGPTDLWNTTWTPGNINHAATGLRLFVSRQAHGAQTIFSIDHIKMSVWFEAPLTVPSDDPPRLSRSSLYTILDAWGQPIRPVQRANRIVQGGVGGARKLIGPPFRLVGRGGLVG